MKKVVSILLVCLCNLGFAQQKGRIAYIDSDFILSKMPEYEEANKELKKRTAEWETVIERKKKEIKDLKDQLSVERPLLTQQLIDEKEEDIQIIEKELLEFQQEKFGTEGDYFKQKLNLAKPLQDQISTIVEEIAKRKRYSSVIDKSTSSETALLYVNSADEISDQVLRKLEQTRNKSKLSKKEIEQLEIAERQIEIKERQRSKRDELEERQRQLEEEKEQLAANQTENTPAVPAETAAEKRQREQLERIEKAKAERERIRQEKLAEIEKRKADILKKQEEARLAREKAREEALKRKENAGKGSAQPSSTSTNKQLSEKAQQLKAQQEQRKKEAADRKAKALEERKKQIDERKKKLEEDRQKRLKEIEDRKKNNQ
ncbi:Outer membrane protein (OmpH-like) [Paenimyroides aquimaris]|uniref:Outer membrane protein (OmpH-like) n=1 Tax=Paenimyroides marinum TaxID=1159016 RepID=A0A1H6MJI5_9FLAO|nr:OmpH family outer membrane protein [Paenimyroides aquimaris]SEI01857.1 Outer membrane protein (OmpH-like) [Paenimyroides aquimaris]